MAFLNIVVTFFKQGVKQKKKIGIVKTTFPQNSLNFYGKMALEVLFYVKNDEESIYRIKFWKKNGNHLKNAFFVN